MEDYAFIDLHTHTEYSHEAGCDDSIETVLSDAQEIAERSGKNCLIAITDHNTVLGVAEAKRLLKTGKYPNVKLISGAEFSVDMGQLNGMFNGREVFKRFHILAYGFDENNPELIEFSHKFHEGKRGYLSLRELVDIMKKAGGKLVIAHPGLIKVYPEGLASYNGTDVELQRQLYDIAQNSTSSKTLLKFLPNNKVLLKLIVEKIQKFSGGLLVGMERFHPDNYSHHFDKFIEEICRQEGLIQTAGSDFHGYHLHTEFSVGNPFTTMFQEFYKELLNDCTAYKNGIHVSHTPGIEILEGKEVSQDEISNGEIKYISGNGEMITEEQYGQVISYFGDMLRKKNLENDTERNQKKPKKKKRNGSSHNNYKHKKCKGKKHKFYYTNENGKQYQEGE